MQCDGIYSGCNAKSIFKNQIFEQVKEKLIEYLF